MQNRYSKMAEQALKYAEALAKRKRHNYIGTEHILVGLVREEDSVAGQVLFEHEVQEQKLLELLDELIAPEGVVLLKEPEGYSPRAKKNTTRE